jgi:hypothetical protein
MHPVAGPRLRIGRGGHTDSTAAFVLENLFARKLGLAEALVDGGFAAVAQLRFRSHDQVEDPLGTGQSEWTTMLTYLVEVTDGAGALPDATAAYSRLIWADPAKLPQALAQRDALLLDMTLNPIEVCIHGLCIRVAARLLDQIA